MIINMKEFADAIRERTTIGEIQSVIEIGSCDGADAIEMAKYFNVSNQHIHIFEPHPTLNQQINQRYPDANIYDYALGDQNKDEVDFHAVDLGKSPNHGVSSLGLINPSAVMNIVKVKQRRYDTVATERSIQSADMVKIDAEGFTYEVLSGMGDWLDKVKALHIECEHKPTFTGHKTYCDIEKFLFTKEFMNLKTFIPNI